MKSPMIITPKCPHCGEVVKINVNKVDRLELENKNLRERIEAVEKERDLLKFLQSADKNSGINDIFGDFFGNKKK